MSDIRVITYSFTVTCESYYLHVAPSFGTGFYTATADQLLLISADIGTGTWVSTYTRQ